MVSSSRRVSIASIRHACLGDDGLGHATGTLVHGGGFVPIGFARAGRGEDCIAVAVLTVALLASWIRRGSLRPCNRRNDSAQDMKAHGGGHDEPGRFMRLSAPPSSSACAPAG